MSLATTDTRSGDTQGTRDIERASDTEGASGTGALAPVAGKRYIATAENLVPEPLRDTVSVEEPLEISLLWEDASGREREQVFTVTMRTPGDDSALALGLLHSEGLIRRPQDVVHVRHRGRNSTSAENQLEVALAPGIDPDLDTYRRHLATQSSCGVCGKTSLQAIELKEPPPVNASAGWLDPAIVAGLCDTLRAGQRQFRASGGVHAAGLFCAGGELLALSEDVGRHNALDKLVGGDLYLDRTRAPTDRGHRVLVLSGRISFELVQKAIMAGLPVIVAVGAPSSLAITLARRFDLTLIGFVSGRGFNVYSAEQRLKRT